jgi:transposase InsO family protein
MDIAYIPIARGFVYLAVVLDWFSPRVLSWRVSITMEAAFCVETLEEALAKHSKPEIFDADQGSQFTGAAFTGLLIKNGIAVSMNGKGAWRDNVRRAVVAQREIRRGVSQGLRQRGRGPHINWPLSRLLQRAPTSLEP